jgi:hypothetical protein
LRVIFIILFLIVSKVTSAATRNWAGATTGTIVWTGNWGTNPIDGDDLNITTTGTLIITGVPSLSLNSIAIHGGSNFTVEFQGVSTLTIGGNASTDFTIDASTGFILSSTNAPSITLASNATSAINGVFTLQTGSTFTTSNTSTVTTVSTTGSIINSGTITGATASKLIFEGSSSYEHKLNGGTIPTADWNGATNTATSTCLVTGMTNTKPIGLIATSNTFYHLTWNCTSQSANLTVSGAGALTLSGESISCLGNFTITSCNGYTIAFSEVLGGTLNTLTVGGNMIVSNGVFYFNWYTTPVTANITGDLTVNGGTIYGFNFTSGATTVINVSGSVNVSSGTLIVSESDYSGVTFNITLDLNISGTGVFRATSNGSASPAINIGRNLAITAGVFRGLNSGSGSPIISVNQDVVCSGGTLIVSNTGATGTPILNISRDLLMAGGTFYAAYLSASNTIVNITRNLTVSSGNIVPTQGSGSPIYTIGGHLTVSGGTFWGSNQSGSPTFNISGNIAISGNGVFRGTSHSGSPIYNVAGSLSVSGGSTVFYGTTTDVTGIPTFNVQGSVDLSTGTVGATDGAPTSTTPVCLFNLTGTSSNNLSLKTGLSHNAGCPWSWTVSSGRTVTLLSDIEIGGTASSCVFTNNGTLVMGTYIFPAVTTAVASFVNASGSILKTGHLSGLSTTAATGAIQTSGTDVFSSLASYVFNGVGAQVTGNWASSTTPTANTVVNLTSDNAAGVTFSNASSLTITGDFTVSSGTFTIATYDLNVKGNFSNSGTYTQSSGTVVMNGASAQTISGSSTTTFNNLQIANTSGDVSLLVSANVNSTLTMTSGDLTIATTKSLTILDVVDPGIAGGSISSMIITPGTASLVKNYSSTTPVTFPLGDGSIYKPLTITPSASTASNITTRYARSPYSDLTVTGGLHHVSTSEYWTVIQSVNLNSIVQLAWVINDGVSDYASLQVTKYNGADWQGIVSTPSGSNTAGNLPTSASTTIGTSTSYFTIGTTTSVNILPIQLISFVGTQLGLGNELEWITNTEINNDYFTIEKSTDGINFYKINTIKGAGESFQFLTYTMTDFNVEPVINYYRLSQADFNGNSTYCDLISVDNRREVKNKTIVSRMNILGQAVNEDYNGIVIIRYLDNSVSKMFQK